MGKILVCATAAVASGNDPRKDPKASYEVLKRFEAYKRTENLQSPTASHTLFKGNEVTNVTTHTRGGEDISETFRDKKYVSILDQSSGGALTKSLTVYLL